MAITERTQVDQLDLRMVESTDCLGTLAQILDEVPDVIVVTLAVGPIHPLRVCREVADRSPVSRVLVQAPADQAAHSYQALRVGAWGCIDSDAGPGELHEAAEAAARGEARLPARHAAWVLRELDSATEPAAGSAPTPDRMTAAERMVLRLLADGSSPEEIAEHLDTTPRVVGRHAGAALSRLHQRYRRPATVSTSAPAPAPVPATVQPTLVAA
jgi:two-component system, NarL family, nitrate/nitrite response regulator NarL